MISLEDLNYSYPEQLVAQKPQYPPRVMLADIMNRDNNAEGSSFSTREIQFDELSQFFKPGDILLLNDTKVLKRRIFSSNGLEILFLHEEGDNIWQVLFPAKKTALSQLIYLPGEVNLTLLEKGLPQRVKVDKKLDDEYFSKHGEFALPPYIQKARGQRHNQDQDKEWYQTQWAKIPGSSAAPTASLHFQNHDLEKIKARGVDIAPITLHVGLGTFMPIRESQIENHKMHSEWVEIPQATVQRIIKAKRDKARVWALGTTVTRAVESWAKNMLKEDEQGNFYGNTDIFISPGFPLEVVDCLITNFHQPKSTLIALLAAFCGIENVMAAYNWAIEEKFRLFSYGDMTVWLKK